MNHIRLPLCFLALFLVGGLVAALAPQEPESSPKTAQTGHDRLKVIGILFRFFETDMGRYPIAKNELRFPYDYYASFCEHDGLTISWSDLWRDVDGVMPLIVLNVPCEDELSVVRIRSVNPTLVLAEVEGSLEESATASTIFIVSGQELAPGLEIPGGDARDSRLKRIKILEVFDRSSVANLGREEVREIMQGR